MGVVVAGVKGKAEDTYGDFVAMSEHGGVYGLTVEVGAVE